MVYIINRRIMTITITCLVCISFLSTPLKTDAQADSHTYITHDNPESESILVRDKYIRKFNKLSRNFEKKKFDKVKKQIFSLRNKRDLSIYEEAILKNYEGNIYFEQKEYNKALDKFKQIVVSRNGLPVHFYNRLTYVIVQIHFEIKEYELTIQAANEPLKYFNEDANLHAILAESYFRLKQYINAETHIDESIRLVKILGSSPKRGWFFTGVCNELLQKKPIQAKEYLDEIISLYTDQRYIDASIILNKFITEKTAEDLIMPVFSPHPLFKYCYSDI